MPSLHSALSSINSIPASTDGAARNPILPSAPVSITELGFVRVIAQVPVYATDLERARKFLLEIKSNPDLPFELLPDTHGISCLPPWVKTPRQTTDGHLIELARANGAVLAAFDRGIPGAFQIP